MTKTLNPTITITVSGPTGSGKSRVLAVIADVLKLIHGDCIIEAPDVKAEKEMCGDDHLAWHKPRSGTLFKPEEINQPVNTGRCIVIPITVEDLCDRPVPVHIQELMSKLGITFEEYKETSLQPVVDLVNWALMTPKLPAASAEEVQNKQPGTTKIRNMVIELVDQQIKGNIDPVTARAIWYNVTKDGDVACLASNLTFALNCAVDRCHHKIMARGLNTHGIPEALPEQELQAENISHIYNSIILQLYGRTDMVRAHKFWQKTLEEMKDDKSLLVEILIQVIADINNQQDIAQ